MSYHVGTLGVPKNVSGCWCPAPSVAGSSSIVKHSSSLLSYYAEFGGDDDADVVPTPKKYLGLANVAAA